MFDQELREKLGEEKMQAMGMLFDAQNLRS